MSKLRRAFLPSPALSLSLAGIFQDGRSTAASGEVETVEISSENSGAGKYRSDEEEEEKHIIDECDDDDENCINGGEKKTKKKRKKYHRHTPEQITEMEALFKESPHPDENQRLQLSKQLGLHPRQVKFWFQNRRTQIKAIQERHENSVLKTEMDKLRDENKVLRETLKSPSCPNCGFATTSGKESITAATDEQRLRIENATLKTEVEKLRSIIGKSSQGTSPNTSSCSPPGNINDQENRSSFDFNTGNIGLERLRVKDTVKSALNELIKMATHREPLWVPSYETGREILNYDEYTKQFGNENYYNKMQPNKSIEASKDSAIIFVDLLWLVRSFMDANRWQELFPCLISSASTVDVICNGEGENGDGAVHLMFAEIQMLTPMVATREMYFFRHCKKVSTYQWAIVDVSIDEDNIDASSQKCRKRPSGCIIEDKSNGHCKVTWVEHIECQKIPIHSLYRSIVNKGLAFGARHWICTLQQQCERLVFHVATNVPVKDSSGVDTLAGRKSILTLSQRMSWSFCRAIGGSRRILWKKIVSKTGDDIRVSLRNNLNEQGEPIGTILSAVSSVWLPLSHHALFDFLRDENRRNEWDIMSNGSTVHSTVNLAKGQDRGNAVTVMDMKGEEQSVLVLQDSCTNAYESMVVYAPVDIKGLQSVMTGCDSSKIPVLPSGFAIISDGIESRPFVFTSTRQDEKSTDGGSLLTVAFQILISNATSAELSMDSVDSVNTLISCTLQNIKRSLHCED